MSKELEAALGHARATVAALEALLVQEAAKPQDGAPSPALAPAPQPAPPSAAGIQNLPAFFAHLKASDRVFGGRLTIEQVKGCERILKAGAGRLPASWMAYCLATSYHETGHLMTPVRERGNGDGADADTWDDYLEKYDTGRLAANLGNTPEADGDGVKFAGRGDVQLTGARNYQKATEELRKIGVIGPNESLVETPDLALRPDVSAAILVLGMIQGWFTGKTLRNYIPATPTLEHFTNARRIINGTDRAALIAGYAMAFYKALLAGDWK